MISVTPEDGFTLLEVVVALAIVAFALAGSMQIARSSTQSIGHLEAKIEAHWVAENVAALLALSEPGEALPQTFSEVMMGRSYLAEVSVQPDREVRTVAEITVSTNGAMLIARTAWLPPRE